jgi:hypothetical protein
MRDRGDALRGLGKDKNSDPGRALAAAASREEEQRLGLPTHYLFTPISVGSGKEGASR